MGCASACQFENCTILTHRPIKSHTITHNWYIPPAQSRALEAGPSLLKRSLTVRVLLWTLPRMLALWLERGTKGCRVRFTISAPSSLDPGLAECEPSQNFGRPVVTVCLWGDVTREPPILAVPRAAGLWNCMGAAATSEPACTDHAPILTSKTRLCARSAILRMRDKQQCTETLPSLQIMITHCSAYGGACTVSHVPITIMRQKIVEGTI